MSKAIMRFGATLLSVAIVAALSTTVMAGGRKGGLGVDVDVSLGGSGLGVDIGADVGGISTDIGAGVGGSGIDAGLGASVGGLSTDVDASVGTGGIDAGATASVGGATGGTPGNPGNGGTAGPGRTSAEVAVSQMSDKQLAIYNRQCKTVLRNPIHFNRDLISLCLVVQSASR